jgi:hypothetical protein
MPHQDRFARHLCVSVDAKGYGSRDDVAQEGAQRALLEVLDEAGAAAGLIRGPSLLQP